MNSLSKADAINLVNKGKVICMDTTDGFVEIKKKKQGLYSIIVHINKEGEKSSLEYNGHFSNLLKTMNSLDGYYLKNNDQ